MPRGRFKKKRPQKIVHVYTGPVRDMTPISENGILEILKEQNERAKIPPSMTDAEFLTELYSIIDVLGLESFVTVPFAARILRLRAKREGFKFKYSDVAVRNKIGQANFWPLGPEEKKQVFGANVTEILFHLREVLTVPLGRHPAGHKPQWKKQYEKPGRPSNKQREERALQEEILKRIHPENLVYPLG